MKKMQRRTPTKTRGGKTVKDQPPKRSKLLRFKLGSRVKNYIILDKTSLQTTDFVKPLGEGGAGIVFLAHQTLHQAITIKRAIKFFMYRDDIANLTFHDRSAGISNKDFLNEIVNISDFSHENLVKVTDAGLHLAGKSNIPYIVTDFIDGPTIRQVIEEDSASAGADVIAFRKKMKEAPEILLRILIQIAAAMKLLHDNRFMHCDMAPKNIFLKRQEGFKAIVGDLGAGRSLKRKGRCRVIGTEAYMPVEMRQYLYRVVSHKEFESFFPRWDIFAFAKTGLELTSMVPKNSQLPWLHPLQIMLEECRDGIAYKDISDISNRLRWLLSVNRSTTDVAELSPTLLTKTRRLMPIDPLATTDRVRRLIWHPALLRLAKVPQLTAARHVFPGAIHTRYEHSLGTMETMRRYLMNLVGQNDFQEHLSSGKIETALLCALFSSLTRFPLSTILREIRGPSSGLFNSFSKNDLLDEIFSIKDSKGLTLPDCVKKDFPRVDIDCMISILTDSKRRFTKEDELIYSLLNCSLDVRVIDFVRRDSLHLGISRQTFDMDELLAHLKIHHHRLALAITGVSTAEEIITLRYTLFNRIYWNRPNRAFVAMVRYVLLTLATKDVISKLRAKILSASEADILSYLLECAYDCERGELINIIEILQGDGRRHFQVILEASPKEDSELSVVCQRVREMDHVRIHELASDLATSLAEILPKPADQIARVPILIDIPIEPGSGNKLGEDILVIYPKQDITVAENLSHVSGIVKGVNDSFSEYLCRMRVMLHPDIYPDDKVQRDLIRKRIREYLMRTVQ